MVNKQIIISFSSRKHGNCGKIADFISNIIENVRTFRFSEFQIQPCGVCNCECFISRSDCPYFGDMEYRLLDAICASDRAYFVVPNYCDYPCANFFIFNERSQCYFQNREDLLERYLEVPKKFIVVSNTNQENFQTARLRSISKQTLKYCF